MYQKCGEISIGSLIKISHFSPMQVWDRIAGLELKFQQGVVTFGNFDGLHLGHRALLSEAERHPHPHVVFTFDPHPVQVLHPEKKLRRLFPREDVAEQLPSFGVDLLVVLPFTREFAALEAEDFLKTYVETPFSPKHLVVGHDFALGKDRRGNLEFLKQWGLKKGIAVHIVEPLRKDGIVISSGKIRDAIAAGNVELAALWLQRPYYLRGKVIAGDGRGSGIGFPTINQSFENETLPEAGVYASTVRLDSGQFPAVTNIGVNPTFNGSAFKVESFILSGNVKRAGDRIDLDLLKRLRAEKKFSSVEDLKKQIEHDILEAKAFHQIG